DGGTEERRITYADLDRDARAIAARLLASCRSGDRALLVYPPGLEFVSALFGCFYAGVVAVPAYPPRHDTHVPRVAAIMADAGTSTVLTTAKTLASLRSLIDRHAVFGGRRFITTDDAGRDGDGLCVPVAPDALALLQYTSGSTGTPKGVMVSHGNVTYNA